MVDAFSLAALALVLNTGDQSPPATDGSASKVICKKSVDTGSLVRARKVCRTRAEWEKANTIAREQGQRLQDRGLVAPTEGK
jgi:hypothetical protein